MKKAFLILSIVFLSALLLEIILRLTGHKPWKTFGNKQQSIYHYDLHLGWKSKMGKYLIPSSENLNKTNILTIEKSGNRTTGIVDKKNKKKIIFIGGSFTQGAGVSDNETYSYKIQKKKSNSKVYNFGQSGYGGIQSLLLLEKQIKKIKHPDIIVYGFIEHHLQRNVARSEWMEILLKASNQSSKLKPSLPYGIIDKNNNLKIMPLTSYLTLPLREHSALVTILEKIYMKQTTRHRKKHQFSVFKETIIKMNKIAQINKSKFFFVNLDLNNKKSDKNFRKISNDTKIPYLDCRVPDFNKYKLIQEWHPNALGHTHYNNCIADFIEKNSLL
mgnify:FL=1